MSRANLKTFWRNLRFCKLDHSINANNIGMTLPKRSKLQKRYAKNVFGVKKQFLQYLQKNVVKLTRQLIPVIGRDIEQLMEPNDQQCS